MKSRKNRSEEQKRAAWLRPARELSIIVVGILIAFGLDAAWSHRNDRRREAEELRGIRAEMALAEDQLRQLVRADSLSLAANEALIALARRPTSGAGVEVPDSLFRWVMSTVTFEPPMGRIESMLASGNLALVEDLRLREKLASWPSQVRDAREHQDRMRDFWMSDLAPYLRRHVAADAAWERRSGAVVDVPATPELLALLYQRRFHASIVAGRNGLLLEELRALRAHLDSAVVPGRG